MYFKYIMIYKKIEFNEFISNIFINKNQGIQKVICIDILLHIVMQSSIIKLTSQLPYHHAKQHNQDHIKIT